MSLIIFIFLVFIVITVSNVVDHLKNWNVKIFRWEDCSPILFSPSTMPVMVVRSPLTEVPSSRLKTKDFEPGRPHSEPTWWSYLQPGNPEYSLGWNTSPVCKLISVRSEVGEEQVARTTWSSNGEVKVLTVSVLIPQILIINISWRLLLRSRLIPIFSR